MEVVLVLEVLFYCFYLLGRSYVFDTISIIGPNIADPSAAGSDPITVLRIVEDGEKITKSTPGEILVIDEGMDVGLLPGYDFLTLSNAKKQSW